MGNRATPPEPPEPPKWQQVIAPPVREEKAPAPPSVLAVPEDGMEDPRERVEWFARLPDHAKEELRDRWRAQEGARGDQVVRRKETSNRWAAEGAGLFFLSVALLQEPTRFGLLLAAGVGAAIGWAASRVKPSPLVYGLAFTAAYVALAAFSGFRNLVYGILSIPLVLCLAVALATTRRIQRFDSTDL